jgi:DNA-binding MarR family transcriptional regulator
MAENASQMPGPGHRDADDIDAVTAAVLAASHSLLEISARTLTIVEERVTLPQFRTLVVLASTGETKLSTLARHLAVNPSTAMRMVDRLTSAGLTNRRINPANRRETLMRLTAAGQQIVDDVTARRREEIAAIVSRMPADQRGGLITALRAFSEAGQDHSIEAPGRDVTPFGWD